MHHRFVIVISKRLEKQQLRRRTRITRAEQACVKNASGVKDDRVARRNEIGEIAKRPMLDQSRLTMNDHQPALIAPRGWYLRYLIGREIKVVVIGSASVSYQKSEGCDPFDGIVNPKCRYACAVAMRPRGVRCRNPF